MIDGPGTDDDHVVKNDTKHEVDAESALTNLDTDYETVLRRAGAKDLRFCMSCDGYEYSEVAAIWDMGGLGNPSSGEMVLMIHGAIGFTGTSYEKHASFQGARGKQVNLNVKDVASPEIWNAISEWHEQVVEASAAIQRGESNVEIPCGERMPRKE